MKFFHGYMIIEQIDETFRSVVYRARAQNADSGSVILKALRSESPSQAEIARIRHEYEIIRGLDISGIVKPLDVIEYQDGVALVLEDFGGISLNKVIGEGLPLERFLTLAMHLAETLGNLHKAGITHRDIKPSNIILNWEEDIVKLTDFGIAAEFTQKNKEIYNPWIIQGTLTYISPEQTGRMNCPVDYRSDLYSLGVTFYEMLTGAAPFMSNDPMEIIHAHIARAPIPPHTHKPDIPPMVSAIVMKLLAKAPEERYQNSFGLLADLRACLSQLTANGKILPFELARQDISIRFIIPQMLVGREAELNTLKQAFDRVSQGGAELMLVAGEPGIGKSALIQEIHKPIVARHGYFVSGKYEELRRHLPYSGIIQAFQGLARLLLSESEDRISVWKQALVMALGDNGKIITDTIPEIELIIGEQKPIPEMGPEESRNRFNLVVKQFVRVFGESTHPLVLFLDDLQWADTASLNLIQTIATDPDLKHLLIIGAYRDNEVPAHHPLMLTLEAIRKTGLNMQTITLEALTPADVNKLISSFLRNPEHSSQPLAHIIHAKTKGNPFFVTQFLKMLYSDRHIVLDPERGWTWDTHAISELKVTENVVEFMAGKLGMLEPDTRQLLEICACIGNRFDAETLAALTDKPLNQILSILDALILEGFIHLKADYYRFHHDRIQEAAYSLLSGDARTQLHYRIGTLNLAGASQQDLLTRIFFIVDHLNKANVLVTTPEEKLRLAELNLKAGIKAKDSTAYHAAAEYLRQGIEILPAGAWEQQYELTFALHMERMECVYLDRDFEEAQKLFEILKTGAANRLDKAKAYSAMVVLYINIRPPRDAILLGLEALTLFDLNISIDMGPAPVVVEMIKVKYNLKKIGLDHVLDLPLMQDQELLAIHEILRSIAPAVFYVNPNLFAYIVLLGVNASLRHGHTPHSASAFICLASIVGNALDDFALGNRIAEIALKLNDKLNNPKVYGSVLHIYAFFLQHWKKHAKHDIDIHRKVFELSYHSGDFLFAGHSITAGAYVRILIGHRLDDILEELNTYRDFIAILNDPLITSQYRLLILTILNGKTGARREGDQGQASPTHSHDLERFRTQGNKFGLCYALFAETTRLYLSGKYHEALEAAQELDRNIKTPLGTLLLHGHYYFYSLILTALLIGGETTRKKTFLKIIRRNQQKLAKWGRLSPENFNHKYDLVAAELALIEGRTPVAMRLFHAAIEGAHRNEYPPEEGVACLRTAEFYLSHNCMQEARTFLSMAHRIYSNIGMTAKVLQLEEQHPFLNEIKPTGHIPKEVLEMTSTQTASTQLDLSTVMKVSQAISSEIMLDRLLQKVMHMFVANAGAQRGFLILEMDGRLTIEASEEIDAGEIKVLQSEPLDTCENLARTIVHYVYRSGQDLIIGNALEEGAFQHDAYIQRHACKSILCAQIMNKGKLAGILYMENNLVANAFTSERLKLLRIISAQAAISLENARLFELATTDGLTKLFVYRYFQLLLDQEIHNFHRFQRPFSILMLDIDDFKRFNDSYGHQTGDRILRNLARTLKNNTRAVDMPARYGGEEFVIILPETDSPNALIAAEKLRACVEEMEIVYAGERLRLTISLGIATFPTHAMDKESLIRSADEALYRAKRTGKNRVCAAETILPSNSGEMLGPADIT